MFSIASGYKKGTAKTGRKDSCKFTNPLASVAFSDTLLSEMFSDLLQCGMKNFSKDCLTHFLKRRKKSIN